MTHTTESADPQAAGISRRDMLLGMCAVAAAATVAGTAQAEMAGHDHSKHRVQQPDVLEAVNQCIDAGRRCISHCLVSFQEGDTELADCAAKVHEMQAICEAFSYLVTANSGYVRAYADICAQVCTDCEKECRKHEQHFECMDCADACADLVDQIALRIS